MLLEQATQVFKDMQAARVRPDATAWNSLIASAGRAGNLQRAQEVLEDMMVKLCTAVSPHECFEPCDLLTCVQQSTAGDPAPAHHVFSTGMQLVLTGKQSPCAAQCGFRALKAQSAASGGAVLL